MGESLPRNRVEWAKTLPKGGVGAEVGVDEASFSKIVWRTAHPRLLWLVDCWESQPNVPYNVSELWYLKRMCTAMGRAAQVSARGQVRPLCAYSEEAAEYVPDESLDWAYIDAGHTFAEALVDFEVWYPKVKTGGMFAGHDYVEGVEAVGVIEAVAEFRTNLEAGPLHVTEEKTPSFWWEKL